MRLRLTKIPQLFMWVWLVDSQTWCCSWTCSIPTLVSILFSPVSHPYISQNKKKKLNVLLNEICTVRVNTIEVHITINIMYMQICMRSQKWVVAIYCNFRWLHCLVWVSHPHGKKKWFTCHWGLLEARWTTSLLSSGRQNITQFFFVNCLDIHILLTTPNYNHVDFQAWSIRQGQINHYLFTR